MKNKRLISLLTITVLLFSLIMTGCAKNKPDEVAKAICDLVYNDDISNISKLGITEDEKNKIVKQHEDSIKSQAKKTFSSMGIVATDEQLNSLIDAYKDMYSNISYEVSEVSRDSKTAEVKVSATHCNEMTIIEKATIDALEKINSEELMNFSEVENKYVKMCMDNFIDGFKNAEISSDKYDCTFKLKLENNYWVPEDSDNCGFKLSRLALGHNDDINLDDIIATPEETAEMLWKFYVKGDCSALNKFGFSEYFSEKLLSIMKKYEFDIFKKELTGLKFSDEQIQGVLDALIGSISKNEAKFEEISNADNEVKMKMSVTQIDFTSMVTKVADNTQSQVISQRMSDKGQIINLYCNNIIEELNNEEPVSSDKEIDFTMIKVENLWWPKDFNKYLQDIMNTIIK